MVNEEKATAIVEKIEDGSFGPEDLEDYLVVFCDVASESEDIEEEVEGWDRVFQIKMDGSDNFWLKIEEGKFTSEKGDVEEPDIELEMADSTAAGIFTGEIDATSAYMAGDLKITGPLPDAVKFRTITEMVREELEEYE